MTAARALLSAVGLCLMAYAVVGILTGPGTQPREQALFMAVLVLGHEGILVPTVAIFGWATLRLVPAWARAPVRAALVVTLALAVVAVPFIVNADRFPDNPSLLPLDYRRGLLLAVGVTWLVAAAVAVSRRRGRRGARKREPYGGSG